MFHIGDRIVLLSTLGRFHISVFWRIEARFLDSVLNKDFVVLQCLSVCSQSSSETPSTRKL